MPLGVRPSSVCVYQFHHRRIDYDLNISQLPCRHGLSSWRRSLIREPLPDSRPVCQLPVVSEV